MLPFCISPRFLLPLLTRQDYSHDMARIYESLLLEEHHNGLYRSSMQAEPRSPDIGVLNPVFEEEKPNVVKPSLLSSLSVPAPKMVKPGLLSSLSVPDARNRRMSTASMISAISRRSQVPKGDVKDDKTVLKSALKDTSALGRTKMGMQRWRKTLLNLFSRHLAGETEQELRLEAELLQLAVGQPVEEDRQSEGRKISQSWLNAAERVTRKTSVVSVFLGNINLRNLLTFVFRQVWPA